MTGPSARGNIKFYTNVFSTTPRATTLLSAPLLQTVALNLRVPSFSVAFGLVLVQVCIDVAELDMWILRIHA